MEQQYSFCGCGIMAMRHGFVFSLDTALAITIAIFLIAGTFYFLNANESDAFSRLYMTKFANDLLITADKNGTLETLNTSFIRNMLSNTIASNFASKITIDSYQCFNQQCQNFSKTNTTIMFIPTAKIDVVLVFDTSGSMDDDGIEQSPGVCFNQRQPICDAKEAAKGFIDLLDPVNDRSGLVAFNTTAILSNPLTYNHVSIKNGLTNLVASGNTAIGDGINVANQELQSNGRQDSKYFIILLTDGMNNQGLEPLMATDDSVDIGVPIYTIGLGEDVNVEQLQTIANTSGGKYYFAPTSDQLEGIYNEIAADIFGEADNYVIARRSFLTFDSNRIKYFNIAEIRMWLRDIITEFHPKSVFYHSFEDLGCEGENCFNTTVWDPIERGGDNNEATTQDARSYTGDFSAELEEGDEGEVALTTAAGLINLAGYSSCTLKLYVNLDSNWETTDDIFLDIYDGSWHYGVLKIDGDLIDDDEWHRFKFSFTSQNYVFDNNFRLRIDHEASDDNEEAFYDDIRILCS